MTCPACGETRLIEKVGSQWACTVCSKSGPLILRRCMTDDHLWTATSMTEPCPACAQHADLAAALPDLAAVRSRP